MKYTTLGDTVNTAARLESFSKEVDIPQLALRPCRILIGDSTRQRLGDLFDVVPVGEMELKGKATKVSSYCVLGRKQKQSHASSEVMGEAV
jgi:class 3 adenylate cyclase